MRRRPSSGPSRSRTLRRRPTRRRQPPSAPWRRSRTSARAPARTLTGFDQVRPPLSEWLRTMLNATLRAIRVHARYTRPRCGLPGELSTAMAGLSSSLAVPSAGYADRFRPRRLRARPHDDVDVLARAVAARRGPHERVVLASLRIDRDARVGGAARQRLGRGRMCSRRCPRAAAVRRGVDAHRALLDAVRTGEQRLAVQGIDRDRRSRLELREP